MGLVLVRYLTIAAAIAAACYSLILSRAAHLFALNTAASVPAAVALVPYHAAYIARLAAWRPQQRDRLLRRAVELNPWDYQSWIQLGVATEMQQGDAEGAERDYLRAAEVDHMFLPKWTLTNFYFRQRRPSDFFHWANAALQVTPYSPDPIFAQMWLVSQDAGRIAAAIPERARVLLQYAWFLSNARQFTAIPPVMQRLIARVGSADPNLWGRDDLVASIEDEILREGDRRDGLAIWTSLKHGGWVPHGIPDSEHPLTNGNFHVPFFRHGFDWAPMDSTGATVEQFRDAGTVRITLSGEQPDHCVLLRQYVPLRPGSIYRLAWRTAAQDTDAGSGLHWHLRAMPAKAGDDLVSGDLLGPAPGAWRFRAPSSELAMLSLEYSRPLGRIRAAGTVTLESASLEKE
jgi:tetratricopeptide (TPR) repeat protein